MNVMKERGDQRIFLFLLVLVIAVAFSSHFTSRTITAEQARNIPSHPGTQGKTLKEADCYLFPDAPTGKCRKGHKFKCSVSTLQAYGDDADTHCPPYCDAESVHCPQAAQEAKKLIINFCNQQPGCTLPKFLDENEERYPACYTFDDHECEYGGESSRASCMVFVYGKCLPNRVSK